MKKISRRIFIALLIVLGALFLGKWALIKSGVLLDFDYAGKYSYEAQEYLSALDDSDYGLYYPTWLLITCEEDLKENELGIDLSEIDLSQIDFDKNYAVLTLGSKLRALHPCNRKNVNLENESFWADVYVKKTDDNDTYIYKINKYNLAKNLLFAPSGVFCVL
ncbi:MAG: hypothetical protein LUC92_06690 [Clostridiales bacterium]|nr:hypothetical protein [Clostridiales bacterium]